MCICVLLCLSHTRREAIKRDFSVFCDYRVPSFILKLPLQQWRRVYFNTVFSTHVSASSRSFCNISSVCSDPRTDFDDNAVCSMDDGHDISTRLLQSSLCKRDIQDRHINYYDISILQLLTFGFHKNCYFYNFFAGGVQVIFSLVNSRRYTLLVCKRNTRIRRHCFYRSTVFN